MSLYSAIEDNDFESFVKLVKDPDARMDQGYYPLLTCAYFNRPAMLEHLLSLNPDMFVMNDFNSNALHVAVYNCNMECVKVLVDHTPGLAMGIDRWGRTPLHTAAYNGSLGLLKLLAPHSDLSIRDKYGHTAEQHTNFEDAKKFLNEF